MSVARADPGRMLVPKDFMNKLPGPEGMKPRPSKTTTSDVKTKYGGYRSGGGPRKKGCDWDSSVYHQDDLNYYDASDDDDYVGTDNESSAIQLKKLPSEEMKGEKKKEGRMRSVPSRRQLVECSWIFPFPGWAMVDTDGAVKKGKTGGYGAIIRDSSGDFIAAAAGVSDKLSALYNHVLGVKRGLELARTRNLAQLIVSTNSRFVYLLLTFQTVPFEPKNRPALLRLLADIEDLVSCFQNVEFHCTHRLANQAADYLSKLFIDEPAIRLESYQKLREIIRADAAGVGYTFWM